MKYGELKEELRRQIGLSIGFEGLRGKLDNWGEGRKATMDTKDLGNSGLIRNPPRTSDEGAENEEHGPAISLWGKGNSENLDPGR